MGPFDHNGLLTLARKVHAAAGDADSARLTEELGAFVHALAHHLDREVPTLTRLPPADARLIRRGQARVSAAAGALLRDAEGGCAGPGRRCAARAGELLALLAIQTLDERVALHGSVIGASNRRW
jgi:hypothetical protein